jgi:hypothetical protein
MHHSIYRILFSASPLMVIITTLLAGHQKSAQRFEQSNESKIVGGKSCEVITSGVQPHQCLP